MPKEIPFGGQKQHRDPFGLQGRERVGLHRLFLSTSNYFEDHDMLVL